MIFYPTLDASSSSIDILVISKDSDPKHFNIPFEALSFMHDLTTCWFSTFGRSGLINKAFIVHAVTWHHW